MCERLRDTDACKYRAQRVRYDIISTAIDGIGDPITPYGGILRPCYLVNRLQKFILFFWQVTRLTCDLCDRIISIYSNILTTNLTFKDFNGI